MKTIRLGFLFACLTATLQLWAQTNGNLQLHYISVGQGDGALMITPKGKTVLFDSGLRGGSKILAYLDQLGITKIDYLVTSHYHADHCGGVAQVFSEIELGAAYDRGQPKKIEGTFVAYEKALRAKRRTATPGTKLTLDEPATHPVIVDFVAANGNGIKTNDENDHSLVAVVRFGKFDAEFGGDLSGFEHNSYHDIETSVAPKVGQVEVYKVHHHGSAHSSNHAWMTAIQPKVGIISCGNGNRYGHPTEETMTTLHQFNVTTY